MLRLVRDVVNDRRGGKLLREALGRQALPDEDGKPKARVSLAAIRQQLLITERVRLAG